MALVGFSLSEIILDICELLLSLLGVRVVMQCNDAIIWVLESLPLLPLWGNQVQGTLFMSCFVSYVGVVAPVLPVRGML